MPRVSFTTYCERRTKLSQTWHVDRSGFLGLRPEEQWTLHQYFRLTESLTPEQVHQHWTSLQSQRSSLAQRAGRAYTTFEVALKNRPVPILQTQGKKRKLGKVKVELLVLPQPNARKLARTLLDV